MSFLVGASLVFGAAARADDSSQDPLVSAQREFDARTSALKAVADPAAAPVAPLAAPTAFSPRFDSDVPAGLRAQILEDVLFIQSLHADAASPLHLSVFGSVDGSNYLRYLSDRIKKIGVDDAGGDPAALAYAHGLFNRQKMWFTPNYLKDDMPAIRRVEVLIHEARHTEREAWSHERCPTPYKDENGVDFTTSGQLLAGRYACDDTPIGAYGVGLIMLKNIEKFCESCAPKVRMDARILADKRYRRHIVGPAARQALHDDLYR